jgi:hypothetical protein
MNSDDPAKTTEVLQNVAELSSSRFIVMPSRELLGLNKQLPFSATFP